MDYLKLGAKNKTPNSLWLGNNRSRPREWYVRINVGLELATRSSLAL